MYLTRAGDFNIDSSNNLVLPNGAVAMGYSVSQPNTLKSVNLNTMLTDYVSSLSGTTDSSGGVYGTASGNQITYTPSGGTAETLQFALASPPDPQIGANGSLTATVQTVNTTTNTTQSTPVTLGYMALGTVNNPGGLESVGDSMYVPSNNSGQPTYQTAGQNNTGTLNADYLESSNVDLTQEFSNMIIAQQGFTANSR